MKFQIFTRNYLGKTKNFLLGEKTLAGGAEIYLNQLIKCIRDNYPTCEIEVYQLGDESKAIEYGSIKINIVNMKGYRKKIFPFYMGKVFSKYIDNDAVKIFNYPNYFSNIKTQKRSIGLFHGVEWDVNLLRYIYYESKFKGMKYFLPSIFKYVYFRVVVPQMVRRGISNFDTTVSVDRNIFNYLHNSKRKNKIKVIYNAVDTTFFSPKQIIKPEGMIRVLVPRNLNPARGVFLIPKASKYLKDWGYNVSFEIVGTGPTKKFIQKRVEQFALKEEVKLLGHIGDRVQIKELYNQCDIVLIPTVFSEGTSLSALEAMSMKKPVLMTTVGGLNEIGVNEISKLSIGKSSLEIALSIKRLIDDQYLFNKIASNARTAVLDSHNLEDWQKKWIETIDSVYKDEI